MTRPDITTYQDYRAFLGDLYAFLKEYRRGTSYRALAQRAGFSSPNFLQLVIQGKRNLTRTSIPKAIKGFQLDKREGEIFAALVAWNQASGFEEKQDCYRRLLRVKPAGPVRTLAESELAYLSNSLCPVLREVATWGDGKLTPAEMGQQLRPTAKAREVEKGLKQLQELQLLEQNEQGQWQQSEAVVSTGPEVRSLAAVSYHRQMLGLAGEAIERFPAAERDISAVTLHLSHRKMAELKQRLASFRRELLELARADEEPDQVVQVNLQCFPLTGVEGESHD